MNLGEQVVVSNDCVTDTRRYSTWSTGLLFGIDFESYLQQTEKMPVGILTKALPKVKIDVFLKMIGLTDTRMAQHKPPD